jgi:hypothetical protein
MSMKKETEEEKLSFLAKLNPFSTRREPEPPPMGATPGSVGMRRFNIDAQVGDEDDEEEGEEALLGGYTNFQFRPKLIGFRMPEDAALQELGQNATNSELAIQRELISRYKADPSQANMEAVFAVYEPNLEGSIRKAAARRIPEPAVRGKIYNTFVKALDRYDPTVGTEFHTYLYNNYINRGDVNHYIQEHSSFGKVAKNRRSKLDMVRTIQEQSELDAGRELNSSELKETTGMSLKHLGYLQKEMRREVLGSSYMQSDFNYSESSLYSLAIQRAIDSLPSHERDLARRIVSDDVVSGKVSNEQVAKERGVKGPAISKFKARFRDMVLKELELLKRSSGAS